MLNSSPSPSTVEIPKDPGGGITTFDFIVNKFKGEMAASPVPSAVVSMVSGQEFTIASTAIIKVFRASSYKLDP